MSWAFIVMHGHHERRRHGATIRLADRGPLANIPHTPSAPMLSAAQIGLAMAAYSRFRPGDGASLHAHSQRNIADDSLIREAISPIIFGPFSFRAQPLQHYAPPGGGPVLL